jgi:hypothetical protein
MIYKLWIVIQYVYLSMLFATMYAAESVSFEFNQHNIVGQNKPVFLQSQAKILGSHDAYVQHNERPSSFFASEGEKEKEEEEHHHHEGAEGKESEQELFDFFEDVKRAVEQNDVRAVREFYDQGFDMHVIDEQTGQNLLHIAADFKAFDVFKLLVAIGVDLQAHDAHGYTPLQIARLGQAQSIVDYVQDLQSHQMRMRPSLIKVEDGALLFSE